MNSNKINYVMVGTFIIVMAVALVVTIVALSGGRGASDDYHALYRNVTGVKYGTQVLYEGYPDRPGRTGDPGSRGRRHALSGGFSRSQGVAHPVG